MIPLTFLSPRWIAPAAILGALLGNALLYEVPPGINWILWTVAATLGIGLATRRRHGTAGRPVYLLLAIALAVVAGAPITADPGTHALIAGLVTWIVATAAFLAAAPDLRAIRPTLLLRVPLRAPITALRAASDELHERVHWARSSEGRPMLRGVLLAIPCVVVLGLLLSAADPTFASWRNAIFRILPNWDGRQIVFTVALGIALIGAWRHAATASTLPSTPAFVRVTIPRVGRTEYRIALGSVSALLALFIALQLAYLFGGAARLDGTGVTYAEYAHRGYVELTFVAGIVLSLVLLAERDRGAEREDRTIALMQYGLLSMVVIILASALHRITLYEEAYGYTILRLHARVFAGLLLCAVACVALQLWRGFDMGRLTRQLATIGCAAVIGLTWWNDQAWIASRNIARAAAHDARVPLDAAYLLHLSDDVMPTLVDAFPTLPDTVREQVRQKILATARTPAQPWYAWNYRRTHARAAAQAAAQAAIRAVMPY